MKIMKLIAVLATLAFSAFLIIEFKEYLEKEGITI